MIGGGPIAFTPIAGDEDETAVEVTFNPVSRILPSGTFHLPAQVPTVEEVWLWDDGTPILWDDETMITLG